MHWYKGRLGLWEAIVGVGLGVGPAHALEFGFGFSMQGYTGCASHMTRRLLSRAKDRGRGLKEAIAGVRSYVSCSCICVCF